MPLGCLSAWTRVVRGPTLRKWARPGKRDCSASKTVGEGCSHFTKGKDTSEELRLRARIFGLKNSKERTRALLERERRGRERSGLKGVLREGNVVEWIVRRPIISLSTTRGGMENLSHLLGGGGEVLVASLWKR